MWVIRCGNGRGGSRSCYTIETSVQRWSCSCYNNGDLIDLLSKLPTLVKSVLVISMSSLLNPSSLEALMPGSLCRFGGFGDCRGRRSSINSPSVTPTLLSIDICSSCLFSYSYTHNRSGHCRQ